MRFKSIVCVDIFLRKGKEFLLMRRQNTKSHDGEFELPGGHLEEGEDLLDAMIREAKEELEISLKRDDLHLNHIMHHYNKGRLNFIYEADASNLNPIIGEPEKCSELRWVTFDTIPEETTSKVKQILNNIKEKSLYDTR